MNFGLICRGWLGVNMGAEHVGDGLSTPAPSAPLRATPSAAAPATMAARAIAVITALAIALSIAIATLVITTKLDTTEATLKAALLKDNNVCASAAEMTVYCKLDQDLTNRRYALAASGVSGALWTRYFTCLGGLIMVAVGSIFILMKLEISQGEFAAKGTGVELGLKTSSPGLALTLMGGALLAAAAYTPAKFDIADGPSFIRPVKPPEPSEQFPNLLGSGPPGPVKIPAPSAGK